MKAATDTPISQAAAAHPAATIHCPLCGKHFDPSCAGCAPSCPLSRGCNAVSCPSCGYGFPRPTRLSTMLGRLLMRRKGDSTLETSLANVPARTRVRVTGLSRDGGIRLSKLGAFGIVEGCELTVRQRHPAIVVEVGETTLALDRDVARAVLVSRPS